VLCTTAAITAIHAPTGPAHYQAGRITLADGTNFEVWGDAQGKAFLKNVQTGDRIEMCFAGPQVWADEPPDARQAWALDVRRNVTYTTVGIPGRNATTFPPPSSRRHTL
jgi:hypothetical protein